MFKNENAFWQSGTHVQRQKVIPSDLQQYFQSSSIRVQTSCQQNGQSHESDRHDEQRRRPIRLAVFYQTKKNHTQSSINKKKNPT